MNRKTTISIVLALAALTIAVYAPVAGFGFVQLDDPAYVTENAQVLRGLTADGMAWAFTTGEAANWHPLTWLSHMLDVQLFGVTPGAHHLVGAGLHLLNTLLLFGLLVRLTGARWRSALVAALFAVHPLHVESVAWVAERKDVLSTLFGLLAMWAYVSYVKTPDWRRYAALLVLYALSLMAKPMLVTLPFLLLLLDWWPLARLQQTATPAAPAARRRKGRPAPARPAGPGLLSRAWPLVREKLPLLALAIASSIVTVIVQQRGGAVSTLQTFPFGLRLQNAVVSVVAYLGSALWPRGLTVLYPFPESVPGWQVAGALAVLGAVSLIAYRLSSRQPYVCVGWLWYLVMLVPVAGLVQVGLQARADRYTYLPLTGIFIMVAWGGAALVERRPVLRAVAAGTAAAAVAACAVAAWTQVGFWTDNVTLFTRATMITLNVDEFEAHMSLGTSLGNQGRIDEARQHFSEAARLRPQSDAAHCSLGLALARTGRLDEASREFIEALRLNPANQTARRASDALLGRSRF